MPNLILLNAGTNDCEGRSDPANDPATAADRLQSLIQTCLDGIPDVAIIVSTILPNADSGVDACAVQINAGIKTMVAGLNNPKVILADMHDGFILTSELVDGTHPNDFGYEKMAAVWYAAFSTFVDQISAPQDTGISDDGFCPKAPGFSDSNGGGGWTTQSGSGFDDGPYVHTGKSIGSVSIPQTLNYVGDEAGGADFSGVSFAQLINAGGAPRGNEVDELIIISAVTGASGAVTYTYTYFLGNNNNNFGDPQEFHPPFDCLPTG